MGISVEVDRTNFTTEVIEASYLRPVIVDFFATWCGPCKMLKPILEKLVSEYDFVLAKVDIDRDPELAQTYHVEGVPDVRVVSQGEILPGFVGMMTEPQIRGFLANLHLKSTLETDLAAAQQAVALGNLEDAKSQFARLISQYPQHRSVAIAVARFLVQQHQFDQAEALLSQSLEQPGREQFDTAQALCDLIRLQRLGIDQAQVKETSDQLSDRISEQQKDELKDEHKNNHKDELNNQLDLHFFGAIDAALSEAYEPALQALLQIVERDRKYRNDGARKAMLLVFSLLGDDHPLTKQYRKQLTLALY